MINRLYSKRFEVSGKYALCTTRFLTRTTYALMIRVETPEDDPLYDATTDADREAYLKRPIYRAFEGYHEADMVKLLSGETISAKQYALDWFERVSGLELYDVYGG
jgi:hypothetical protein